MCPNGIIALKVAVGKASGLKERVV